MKRGREVKRSREREVERGRERERESVCVCDTHTHTHTHTHTYAHNTRTRTRRLVLQTPIPTVKVPKPISGLTSSNVADALKETQRFLSQLQYNHTGMQFFPVKKYLPLTRLMEVSEL